MFDIDIIIISYKGFELTSKCVQSVLNSKNLNPNIIIVDNNSPDDTVAKLKELYPNINYIINSENLGYAKAINIGVQNSKSKYLLLSNNDVEYFENTISDLIMSFEENKNIGAIGAQQLFPNLKKQTSFGFVPSYKLILYNFFLLDIFITKLFKIFNINTLIDVDYIDGAAILTSKNNFDLVNGFDESFFFYSEEADFCIKLQKMNLSTCINTNIKFIHYRGAATGGNLNLKNINLLLKSKEKLAKKYLSNPICKIYFFSEYFKNKVLYIISKILYFLTQNESTFKKSNVFNCYIQEWEDIIRNYQ